MYNEELLKSEPAFDQSHKCEIWNYIRWELLHYNECLTKIDVPSDQNFTSNSRSPTTYLDKNRHMEIKIEVSSKFYENLGIQR